MSEGRELQTQVQNAPAEKPSFWQNALRTIKGESTESLMEQFTSEMTLVAEGLSEDQARINRELQSLERRMDDMQNSLGDEQERGLQRLKSQLDAIETTQEEDNRDLSRRLDALERRMDALDKRTAKKPGKWKISQEGLLPHLILLAGIVVGGWVLVTILNLFK